MKNTKEYFEYLCTLGQSGVYTYDCVIRAFEMYAIGADKSVPNAVRMFYECLVSSFISDKHKSYDKFGNLCTKETFDTYIRNSKKVTFDDKSFYNSVFLDNWRQVNQYSHWANLQNLEEQELLYHNKDLLNGVKDACEWIYTKITGKSIIKIFNLPDVSKYQSNFIDNNKEQPVKQYSEIILNNEISKREYIINGLKNEINNLNAKITELKKLTPHTRKEYEEKIYVLQNDIQNKNEQISDIRKLLNQYKQERLEKVNVESNLTKIVALKLKNSELSRALEWSEKENRELKDYIKDLSKKNNDNNKLLNTKINKLNKEKSKILDELSILKEETIKVEKSDIIPQEVKPVSVHKDNEPKNTIEPIQKSECMEDVILEIIRYMNSVNAYATRNTISDILKGNTNTCIMHYFPELKKCKYFNYSDKFIEVNEFLNILLNNNSIKKSGCNFYVVKK